MSRATTSWLREAHPTPDHDHTGRLRFIRDPIHADEPEADAELP